MPTPDPSPELTPSAELFAQFLERCERGEAADFEAFCREHPDCAAELRQLMQQWQWVDPSLREGADSEVTQGGRYQIGGEIARGGMGVVLQAFDRYLNRKVAIKVDEGAAGDARALSRFLDEARITGQLEHPGIVPIYDLGIDATSRCYFTMPLLRGGTFREVIERLHAGDAEWTLPRALGVLLAICDAVASAHAKGVIHRDLKPSNVIVGRFGETYVADWGLARVLSEAERKDIRIRDVVDAATAVQGSRRELAADDPDSPLITMDGDVVGTPAYMPPEQARGEVDQIGPRSDVYSAGAMLYHVLAGEMPYVAKGARVSTRTVLARVLDGPPRPLAELTRKAPPELVAICSKAMARAPQDRYADMRELAADLRAFLELRVVRAYGGGAWAELRKWVRRNRAAAASAAAAVLALVAGLAVSVVQARRADAAAVTAAANAQRADDEAATAKANALRADAEAVTAEANFRLASEAVEELVRIGGTELGNVPQLDSVRRKMLERAVAFQMRLVEARGTDAKLRYRAATAWLTVGSLHEQLGALDQAMQAMLAGITGLEELLREQPERHDYRAVLAWAHNDVAMVLQIRDELDASHARLKIAQELLDEVVQQQPAVVEHRQRRAHLLHHRCLLYCRQGRFEEGLPLAREVLAVRQALRRELPDDAQIASYLARAHHLCSGLLRELNRVEEARVDLETAVRLHTEVLASMPEDREARSHAANAWNEFAVLQKRQRIFTDAEAQNALQQAVALGRGLAQDFPHVPTYHHLFGDYLNNLGYLLATAGENAPARVVIEEAINAQAQALRGAPGREEFQRSLANHYSFLFQVLRRLDDHRELARRAVEFGERALQPKAQTLYSVGVQLLHCVPIVRADEALADDERHRFAEDYAGRAIVTLSAAFDEGWRKWDLQGLAHPSIRGREDFRQLAAKVRAAPREDR